MKRKTFLALLMAAVIFLGSCESKANKLFYVGSINSNKYHLQNCKWAKNIKHENQIWFENAEDAEKSGYKPCKTCLGRKQ